MAQEARSWPGVVFGVGVWAGAIAALACAASSDKGSGTVPMDTGTDAVDSAVATETPEDTAEPDGCAKLCTVFPQCGCGPDDKCDIIDDKGATDCLPAGSNGLNKKCTATGDCAAGFACIRLGTTLSLCRPFCAKVNDCTSTGTNRCVAVTDGKTPPKEIPGFKVCIVACDPANPSKNCGTASCAFAGTDTVCIGAGTSTSVGGCKKDKNACAAGYGCLTSGDCRKWCRIEKASTDCGGSRICQKLADPVPPMYSGFEYGVCFP